MTVPKVEQENNPMKSFKKFALLSVGVGVFAWAISPVLAHCGKCALDSKEIVKSMDKVTLAKCIEAAEAASKGKAISATSALASGKANMDVTCMVGEKAMNVDVDATGKAGKTEDAKGVSGGGDVVKAMGAMTMAKVIEAAEAHSKGKALAITASAAAGKAGYECYCLAGDKLQKVKVDDTGKATGMEEAKMLPGATEEKPKPKPGG